MNVQDHPDVMAALAAMKAELEAKDAELKALRASKSGVRSPRILPKFPDQSRDGECKEIGQFLLAQPGGGWYLVAHIVEAIKDGSRVLNLRKYRHMKNKETGVRELKVPSRFKVNSVEQWGAIVAVGNQCFGIETEAPAPEVTPAPATK